MQVVNKQVRFNDYLLPGLQFLMNCHSKILCSSLSETWLFIYSSPLSTAFETPKGWRHPFLLCSQRSFLNLELWPIMDSALRLTLSSRTSKWVPTAQKLCQQGLLSFLGCSSPASIVVKLLTLHFRKLSHLLLSLIPLLLIPLCQIFKRKFSYGLSV